MSNRCSGFDTIGKHLPVAIVRDSKGEQAADLENLRLVPGNPTDRFVADVINQGNHHVPLIARLVITGQSGTQQEIQSGFSRWLMPGETGIVEFPIRDLLTPDTYELNCELQVAGQIKSMKQVVEIGTANDQSASREKRRR